MLCFSIVLKITVCIFVSFCVQRWTSRVWSSPLLRQTAWTASAMARRKTTTASRAAPATPATQPHIPTDYSRTTVRHHTAICVPTSFLTCLFLPLTLLALTICKCQRHPLPASAQSTMAVHPEPVPPFPTLALTGRIQGWNATQAFLTPASDHWPYLTLLHHARTRPSWQHPVLPLPSQPLPSVAAGSERAE